MFGSPRYLSGGGTQLLDDELGSRAGSRTPTTVAGVVALLDEELLAGTGAVAGAGAARHGAGAQAHVAIGPHAAPGREGEQAGMGG